MVDRVLLVKELYTAPETATILGLGLTKTRELIRKRRLRTVQIGRARRVPRGAIAEFIRELEREAQEAVVRLEREAQEAVVGGRNWRG